MAIKKKILIDVNHAFDVHFLKNLYWILKDKGYELKVTSSRKPLSYELLDSMGIPHKRLGTYGVSFLSKAFKLIWLDLKMLLFVLRFNPDILIGHVSFRAAHIGWLLRKKTILLTDTEHAKEQIVLFKPFCDYLITPDCFLDDLGEKHVRVKTIFELAYLHPEYFKPSLLPLKALNLRETDTFFVLRFVAWDATHDLNEHGFSEMGKRKLIDILIKHGKVFITSEKALPPEFEPYRISVSPNKIHDLMYYATMYIGEGGSMASEAAVLGTPSVYINTLTMGYIESLENDYGLLRRFEDDDEAIDFVKILLENKDLKADWRKKCEKLIENSVDINKYLLEFIEQD